LDGLYILYIWFSVFETIARDPEVHVATTSSTTRSCHASTNLVSCSFSQTGVESGEDPAQDRQHQEHYDKESVDMNSGVRSGLHLLEYCQRRLMVRTKLKNMTKMKSCLLEVTISFQYLTQLEMLLPSILIRRLDFKRSSGEEYRIVKILEVEEYSRQVEQNLRIVGRHGQSSSEALNAGLGVALDTPEVCDLIINFNTLWFLSL